jgi:hypothetical protein
MAELILRGATALRKNGRHARQTTDRLLNALCPHCARLRPEAAAFAQLESRDHGLLLAGRRLRKSTPSRLRDCPRFAESRLRSARWDRCQQCAPLGLLGSSTCEAVLGYACDRGGPTQLDRFSRFLSG